MHPYAVGYQSLCVNFETANNFAGAQPLHDICWLDGPQAKRPLSLCFLVARQLRSQHKSGGNSI